MRIEELVNKINTFDAVIVYESKENVVKKIKQGIFEPLYFSCVEGNERKAYEKTKNKETFISHSASIHIPDFTVEEMIETFKCDASGSYELTLQMIKPFFRSSISEDVVFICYLFLHEVGHYFHFNEMGSDVKAYTEQDLLLYKENFNKTQQVWVERRNRIQRGITCELTVREKITLQNLRDEYRKIPNEQIADNFAFAQLPKVLDSLEK